MAGSTPASLSAEAPRVAAAAPRKSRPVTPAREAWRRFRRHRLAVVSGIVLIVMFAAVALGPVIWPVPINDIDFAAKLQGPSWAHPLGTDDLGQDLLARLLYGGRIAGTVPSLLDPPPGCRFASRCKHAMEVCTRAMPPLKEVGPGHFVRCVL